MASRRQPIPAPGAALTRRAAVAVLLGGVLGALAPWSPVRAAADATFDSTLFTLINQDRAAHGVPALRWSGALSALGETAGYSGCGFLVAGRAEDMIRRNYFAHAIAGCGGRNVFDVMRADGIAFSAAGENIGWANGIGDPVEAAQYLNRLYMASPEHVANILDPAFTAVGTGSWWTAPGQTWTGAGVPLTGVVMSAEEFTAGPARPPAAAAPPPRHPEVPARQGMNTAVPSRPPDVTPGQAPEPATAPPAPSQAGGVVVDTCRTRLCDAEAIGDRAVPAAGRPPRRAAVTADGAIPPGAVAALVAAVVLVQVARARRGRLRGVRRGRARPRGGHGRRSRA